MVTDKCTTIDGSGKSQKGYLRLILLSTIGCSIFAFPVAANADPQSSPGIESETAAAAQNSQAQPWISTFPADDEFDWIQLNSGEWLKGKLRRLYQKKLEFDSSELGKLELDWESVKRFRGHRNFSLLFEGSVSAEGLLVVTDKKVLVTVGENRQEFERTELVAVVPGAARERDYWSAKITLGVNLSRGNSEQTQWSGIANIKRRTVKTRFESDWLGNYAETDGKQTADNQRVSAFFDVFRTQKYFFRPIFGEYFRDPFSNISSRVTVGTAMGYHLIDTAKTEWDVSGGPAYQKTRFDSVPAGQNSSESTLSFVAGTRFNTDLTRTVDFDFRYNFQIVNKQSGTFTHHLVATFSTALTGWLKFDASFVWDRIEDPRPSADGTVPKQNDYYFIFGLGIDI